MADYDSRERHYETIKDIRNLVPVNRAVSVASIKIVIGGIGIGYIQDYTGNQNRTATPLYEVGTVGIVEHIAGQPTYNVTINKLAVYRINFLKMAAQVGMYKSNSTLYDIIKAKLKSNDEIIDFSVITEQAIPFDIVVSQKDPVDPNTSAATLTTTWKECVITGYSETVSATGALTIVENLTLVAKKPEFGAENYTLVYPPTS
ncbi:MAG: hypothetical protein ACFFG0_36015 [Candidatus Thorarchaeota archaeon]